MLKHRPVGLFFVLLAIATFVLGRFIPLSPLLYLFYALAWSLILIFGCYFIGMHYFLPSICRAATAEKVVALSFDDGPAPGTLSVLDILQEKNVEAAFFFIGRHIAGREAILEKVVQEGHLIGNHSFSHSPFFDLFSSQKMLADVNAMSAASGAAVGLRPLLFRPPFGVTNPTVAAVVKRGRYISIGWNLRSYDTMTKNPEKLKARIRRGLRPGGIILLHDTAPAMRQALPAIIDEIRAAGYRLARLDKMCNLNPYA